MPNNQPNDTKQCSRCLLVKSASEYSKDRVKKDGLSSRCKYCHREYIKEYSKTRKSVLYNRQKQKAFSAKHPERTRIYQLAHKVKLADACERCGTTERRLIRHHPDYSKPKDVVSLCDMCHRAVHKELVNG